MFDYKIVVNFSSSNCGSDNYDCYRIESESGGYDEMIKFCYNNYGGNIEFSKNWFNIDEWNDKSILEFWNKDDEMEFGLLCINEEIDCWIVREDCKYYNELWIDSNYEGNEELNKNCVLEMEYKLFM
tara:strand:- start:251 stop:631 length:381 start_codon:yes stop_codon:yes gene_type:complete